MRLVAEQAAVLAHVGADRPELMQAGGIKQHGQYGQDGRDGIHRKISYSISTSGAHRAADRRKDLRLTRRANQAHFAIVEKIIEPAPKPGSGLFVCVQGKFDWRLSKAHWLTVTFESNLTRR